VAMKNPVKFISSFLYIGYVPFASGTVASLAALGLYFLFRGDLFLYTALLVLVFVLGFLVCGKAELEFGQKDSKKIVIDEVAGLLFAFWGLTLSPVLIIIGFLLFRFLDIIKPFPANRVEKLDGSVGVMTDDLIAGLYTNIVLQILVRL